ncbi:MAG TPA: peptidoglycan-binding protein [Candidatus Limnocylindrales bacterium]
MNRRIFLAACGVVAAGGAGAAAVGFGGSSGGTPKRGTQPPKTADITRATLTDFEEVDGELAYGQPEPLRHQGGGTLTWLAPVGSTVELGKPLFKVDNRAVPLLFGPLPLYRPLSSGAEGPDVAQLEQNLKSLGYSGFTADDRYNSATASAVKKWQKDLGLEETGVVAPGQAVYAPGALRVAAHQARVGDPAGGQILSCTGVSRVVTVNLPVTRQGLAVAGATVQVTLAGGKGVAGKVESIGVEAQAQQEQQGQQGQQPTVEVVVSIADQGALGNLQRSPVKVKFIAEERRDVLTVPISALVALSEGGYGLQLVDGATTRYVAVETGLFASGRVEVRGGDLRPGMKVVVPK